MARSLMQVAEWYERQEQSRDAIRDMQARAGRAAERMQREALEAAQEYHVFHTNRMVNPAVQFASTPQGDNWASQWFHVRQEWDTATWRMPNGSSFHFTPWIDPDLHMDEGL